MRNLENFDMHLNESKESAQLEYALKTKLKVYKQRHPNSGLTYAILKKLYERGYKSWEKFHPKNVSQHLWGLTRVNSFLTKGLSWKETDKDLAIKVTENSGKQKHKKYFGKFEKFKKK